MRVFFAHVDARATLGSNYPSAAEREAKLARARAMCKRCACGNMLSDPRRSVCFVCRLDKPKS